ncbi:MAG: CHRD domain-containing protein [Acidobacteriota bacterium]
MKKSFASIILMALTVFSVASLMTEPARADIVVFTAQLLASNEVPPVGNAERNAFGSVTVTLDTTANTARFDASVEGLTTAVILAHIHEAAAGVNGPIRVDSGLSPSAPLPPVNGSVSFTRANLPVPTDVRDRILANPAGFYFNVHSALNPGGVVRGQLVRSQSTTPALNAPTLSEWGAILMTLLFIAASTFFLVGRNNAFLANESSAMAVAPVKAINWQLFIKVALNVEALIALLLIAMRANLVDVFGALASGIVLSYIVHLFIARARRN